jgi:hypothetical protein
MRFGSFGLPEWALIDWQLIEPFRHRPREKLGNSEKISALDLWMKTVKRQ